MARRKKTEEEKEYDVLLANVREMLKARAGKEFIWHILGICDIYGSHFTGNSTTFYNEGKRAVGLQLLQLLDEADPTSYARLILDQQKKEDARNVRPDTDNGTDTFTDTGADSDD